MDFLVNNDYSLILSWEFSPRKYGEMRHKMINFHLRETVIPKEFDCPLYKNTKISE